MGSTETFPPGPTSKLDWTKLDFKVKEVNGHVQSRFSVRTGEWSKPEFVTDPYLRIHGLAPALNYAQQAYEGLKAYRSPNGDVKIFRPEKHATRMAYSASVVSMPSPPESLFLECINLAVGKNAEYVAPHGTGALLYIRPVLFGCAPQVILQPSEEYLFCVYVQPGIDYFGVRALDALVLEDFDRAAPNGTGAAKIGGNYAPGIKYSNMAMKQGYGITMHLDSKTQTEIEEFSACGFIGVKQDGDKITLVVPHSKNALHSVTSETCVELAKHLGFNVEIRKVLYDELSSFSEVLAVGTATSALPIKSITRKSKNEKISFAGAEDGAPGPVCVQLSKFIRDVQQGKREDEYGWLSLVKEPML